MTLVLLATLAVAVVAFVLHPVFASTPEKEEALSPDEPSRERKRLSELKERLYESIQDLDFEKAAGKLSEEDYENARNDYLLQVSRTMARLDELRPARTPSAAGRKKGKRKVRRTETKAPREAGRTCASCGEVNGAAAKFCLACGKPLDVACARCGESLPEKARFCPSCGEKVPA